MKSSIMRMFVILGIVINFAFVQSGWAAITAIYGPYTVIGTVDSERISNGDAVLLTDVTINGYTVYDGSIYGWGPDAYWERLGVDFPGIGTDVKVECYLVMYSDESAKYYASEVEILDAEGNTTAIIALANAVLTLDGVERLIPVWNGSTELVVQ